MSCHRVVYIQLTLNRQSAAWEACKFAPQCMLFTHVLITVNIASFLHIAMIICACMRDARSLHETHLICTNSASNQPVMRGT